MLASVYLLMIKSLFCQLCVIHTLYYSVHFPTMPEVIEIKDVVDQDTLV